MGTYGFPGGLQCTTQIISYEFLTGLILEIVPIRVGSCTLMSL
jgi:hypothetical protein